MMCKAEKLYSTPADIPEYDDVLSVLRYRYKKSTIFVYRKFILLWQTEV